MFLVQSIFSTGQIETQTHQLDFVGRVTQTSTTHIKGDKTLTWIDRFAYDTAGRLLTQKRTLGDTTEILSTHCYNDLGQLQRKTLGGTLQALDYQYNIRGWLTETNDTENLGTNLFAFGLDYLPNGNISLMDWKHTGQSKQDYTYLYDVLNRIETATHSRGNYNVSDITYDLNGNIKTLNRQGYLRSSFGAMDALGIKRQ